MIAKFFNIPRELAYLCLLIFVLFSATIGYQINSISIILLLAFYLIDKNLFLKVKSLSNKVVYFYLIYFVIHLLGLLRTENMSEGSSEVTVKLAFLIIPIIIATEKLSNRYLYYLFVTFKYWLLAYALFLIYHKLLVIGGPLFTLPVISLYRLTGIHHAYFTLFYMFSLFFVFHQIKTKQISSLLGYFQVIFLFFFISILGARIMFGVALVITIIFLSKNIIQLKGLKKLSLFLAIILVIFFIYKKTDVSEKFNRLSKIEWNIDKNIYNHQVFSFDYNESTSNTFEIRLIKWYCASQIIKDNLFLGVGTGDYGDMLLSKYYEIDFKKGMVYGYNTHNQYIEEFLKFGIFGGLFFICFILYILYQAIKTSNYILLCSIITVSAFMLVESIFERQHGVVFFTLFLSLAYLYDQSKKTLKENH